MEEVDYNKILEELIESRKNRKSLVTSVAPQGYAGTLVSGDTHGIHPLNFDSASLYPGVQRRYYYRIKQMIRKRKIERLFKNPS